MTKDGQYAVPGKAPAVASLLRGWHAWAASAWGWATLWFVASRIWLVGATLLGARIVMPAVLSQPERSPLWQTWRRWDADIYAQIAAHGYLPAEVHRTPAFFPLFPLAERAIAPLCGGDTYLAGMLIANAAWWVALVELYRLTEADFGRQAARGAVMALSVFPTALFGFVAYPEALFLALACAALRQMRRHHWLRAAALGMLAALTRQAGILLVLPFLWEGIGAAKSRQPSDASHAATLRPGSRLFQLARHWRPWQWLRALGAPGWPIWLAGLIPLGTVSYALWLWHAVGDPLAFWHAQATWHRTTAWPWQTLWLGWRAISQQPSRYFTLRAVQEWLTVVGVGMLVGLTLRQAPRSYAAFAVPLYLLFLMQIDPVWPLLSQGRFMLEVLPVFAVLGAAAARHRWLRVALVAVGVPMQMGLIIVFAHGGWVI